MTNIELLRSLAKEASAIRNAEATETVKNMDMNQFTLTLAEYPDFIITKQTKRSTKHLIIMPSASTAFIKTEENGKETSSEMLTEDSYSAFTTGMPDIPLPEGFWARELQKGKVTGRRILEIFNNKPLLELLRKKGLPENVNLLAPLGKYQMSPESRYVNAYCEYPNIYLEFMDTNKAFNLLTQESIFCKDIATSFGLENLRDFLRSYQDSLLDLTYGNYSRYDNLSMRRTLYPFEASVDTGHSVISYIPRIKMHYATFRDYVLYDAVRMGYGHSASNFFQIWLDTLNMQYLLYGKITDKYPKDLLLLHNQLAYKSACMKEEVDVAKFNQQSDKASFYEGEYKDYVFIAPQCKQDFYDEATAQSNCLAGYVQRFTDGDCLILFMRHKKTPDDSYITVEIVDGEVVQAKLARNAEPNTSDKAVLYDWVMKCNKKQANVA